jgi:hypothetical protein
MDQFAADVVTTCNTHQQNKKKPITCCPDHPSACPVNNNRQPMGYNPCGKGML